MMPLLMANVGEKRQVVRVNGKDDTKAFLGNLGFVEGTDVTVISKIAGNLIVNVKDTRLAIDKAMAGRIMVS